MFKIRKAEISRRKQEIRRIQISQSQLLLLLSHPQPQPLLFPDPNRPPPPPQQERRRMIQIKLLPPPQLLLPENKLPQPQFVADKSLIISASRFCYALSYVKWHVNVSTINKIIFKVIKYNL